METIIRKLNDERWAQFRALCLKKNISANQAVKELIYGSVAGIEQLNLSISTNLKTRLKKAAEKEGRSLSNLVSWLLQRAMKDWYGKQIT